MSELSERVGVWNCRRRERSGVSSYRVRDRDVVVRLMGPLDATSKPLLMDEMAVVDPRAGDRVVLHLADVTVLDSTGVGALFYLEAFVRARHGRLMLSMPGDDIQGGRRTLERHFCFVEEPGASDGRRRRRLGDPAGRDPIPQ